MPDLNDPSFIANPQPQDSPSGSGRLKYLWWSLGALALALVFFLILKPYLATDSAEADTQAVVARSDDAAAAKAAVPGEEGKTTLKNLAFCAAHGSTTDPFISWYCGEFQPWSKKVDDHIEHKTAHTSSESSVPTWLPLLVIGLVLSNVVSWVAIARKKDKNAL